MQWTIEKIGELRELAAQGLTARQIAKEMRITRNAVMDLARDELGIRTIERNVARSELYTSDEVFLCGTGAQISPVIEIDRRKVGDGVVGPITRRLQDVYFNAVRGENPKYAHWVRPVLGSGASH